MSVVIEEVVGSSAAELLAAGNQAYVDDDFDGALAKYSAALDEARGGGGGGGSSSSAAAPTAASLHSVRAQAFIRLEDYVNAVAEANRAIEADPGLQRGYLRKGVACFWLEEYETAKAAFQTGMGLAEGPEPYRTWIRKCDAEMEDEDGDSGEADGAAPVAAAPAPTPPATANKAPEPPTDAPAPQPTAAAAAQEPTAATASDAAPAPPAPKYRHQWFQSPAAVTLSIMAKGIKADRAIVDIRATTVRVHIKAPGGSDEDLEYALDLELCGAIDPDASKVEFLSTKIEIRLPKADGSGNWPSLERSSAAAASPAAPAAAPAASAAAAVPHPYPTSYSADRKQVKDWDKIESEMKEEEKEEKLEGDAALQKLFRDIYGNADEETRRAMNKSFVESNGTVLSTNWKEIGAKQVECTPPSGMEVKKYEV